MAQDSHKNFDPILDDYAFFEMHSDEAEADVRAYEEVIHTHLKGRNQIHMLDLGCGAGTFTQHLLQAIQWPSSHLHLSLVEPGGIALSQALKICSPFSSHVVQTHVELPTLQEPMFDLILANHVLYYVSPLEQQLKQIYSSLNPGGIFVFAMAGKLNPLIQFWNAAFDSIQEALPYQTAEDLGAALDKLGIAFQSYPVPYEIRFPDSVSNRSKILRFLLAEHLDRMDQDLLLELFEPFKAGKDILIKTESSHFLVCC